MILNHKKLLFIVLISIVGLSCKKDKIDKYRVVIVSDVSSSAHFDNNTSLGRVLITTSPYEVEISIPKGGAVDVSGIYDNGVKKSIAIWLFDGSEPLGSQTGWGSARIQYTP